MVRRCLGQPRSAASDAVDDGGEVVGRPLDPTKVLDQPRRDRGGLHQINFGSPALS